LCERVMGGELQKLQKVAKLQKCRADANCAKREVTQIISLGGEGATPKNAPSLFRSFLLNRTFPLLFCSFFLFYSVFLGFTRHQSFISLRSCSYSTARGVGGISINSINSLLRSSLRMMVPGACATLTLSIERHIFRLIPVG